MFPAFMPGAPSIANFVKGGNQNSAPAVPSYCMLPEIG